MKELNKKVFNTIFIILSIFTITGIIIYNASSYKKEYENIKRNLTFIEDKKSLKNNINSLDPTNDFIINPHDEELDNMMIMDYEVYTVKLYNNKIERIINHSDNVSDFDAEHIANKIINKEKGVRIGNLYNNKYSYNYNMDTIIIINTEKINSRLTFIFIKSILVLISFEIIIYIVSEFLTRKITKPAQESFDKQKDFIADASHELKTPLAVIIASADELKSDKKNQKYIDNIKYESERMNILIKNLLDLSKLENGVSAKSYKEENISKIIERVSLTFEAIAYEQKIGIKTNIESNIIFKCNKEEIERLISIVLDNAIKHSYENSSVLVNASKSKNNIIIKITNTGDPIKQGDEEKIFERFYRADKARNRDTNRYGLGLAIAKNIVNNYNGIIKANSIDNKTIFEITLKK